ncbi:hypothetical protein SAMN02745194_04776 [Roseomonas rosea]|uniref:Uncharacterized protein n=1 Tax=Muricoccus roseus TaxID=198092 RepID=A0A1M6RVW0_9PROT|nr:hypothetical protein [Roseomonas rosea]SHK36449.1 hypothetical protein SAMN02745194_04776 [Roseomonas rosea]
MSEIDDVFARLGGGQMATGEQRDQRTIPRKGKMAGSRVVEVVHLPTRGASPTASVAHRADPGVRAQTWEGGFPAAVAPRLPSSSAQPVGVKAPVQVGHVLTRWTPTALEVAKPPSELVHVEHKPSPHHQPAKRPSSGKARHATRRIADPLDAGDDGANCLRCGYVIQPWRERRGLMTCAGCG